MAGSEPLWTPSEERVKQANMTHLRMIFSSPLSSISGGSDLNGCFAAGNPIGPVYLGELQCRCLGMNVKAFDGSGKPGIARKGELVCNAPFPYTLNMEKVEFAVRRVIQREPVLNKDALSNLEVLDQYQNIPEL
jgi:acyl-coenzyme A synthetase/AMP-(fatty) acid ligase